MKSNETDEVLEFINRRFPVDCNWLSGNCYHFTLILQARFETGIIYYDVINGHFIFEYNGKYYDWSGVVEPDGFLVRWDEFEKYDAIQYKIVVRDCIK